MTLERTRSFYKETCSRDFQTTVHVLGFLNLLANLCLWDLSTQAYCPVTTLPFVSLSSMWENEAEVWEGQSSSEYLMILPLHKNPLHMNSLIISRLLIFKLFIQSFSNA